MKVLVFSHWRNVDNGSADVTSAGRSFQIRGPTTGKARLATVDNMTDGTTRWARDNGCLECTMSASGRIGGKQPH